MESRHFESQSAPLLTPEPPLTPPHFEKSGYAPDQAKCKITSPTMHFVKTYFMLSHKCARIGDKAFLTELEVSWKDHCGIMRKHTAIPNDIHKQLSRAFDRILSISPIYAHKRLIHTLNGTFDS